MPFQSIVNVESGFGIPGELIFDGPLRAESLIVNSSGATPNTVGFAYTKSPTTNVAQAGGSIAGGNVFAGILINPKSYASAGTSGGGTLAPTLNIPDYSNGEFCTMGFVVVSLTNSANIGDNVAYNTTTGALLSVSPAGPLPFGTEYVPGASVHRYKNSSAGLAVIRLTN